MTASDGQPADERSIADLALDVFVYGPAGVLLTAASDMPAMAAKGRERIEQELKNAHVIGRFVVDAGLRQLRGPLGWFTGEQSAPHGAPVPGTQSTPSRPRTRPTTRPAARRPAPGGAASFTASTSSESPPAAAGAAPARDAAVDRAIPAYDTLSASQVVRRLDGLKPRELRAIVRHELANRERRTILHRAEQLLGKQPTAPPASPVPPSATG